MDILGSGLRPNTTCVQELGMSGASSARKDYGQSTLPCPTDVGCIWVTSFGEWEANRNDPDGGLQCVPVKFGSALAVLVIHKEKRCHRETLPPQSGPRMNSSDPSAAEPAWSPAFWLSLSYISQASHV